MAPVFFRDALSASLAFGLVLMSAAAAQTPSARDPSLGRGERVSGESSATRSRVLASHGAAATAHPLATQTAIDVLRAGGSIPTESMKPQQRCARTAVRADISTPSP